MKVWGIFRKAELLYVGLHSTEQDCWQIYLGWPSDQEIADAKREGKTCERVSLRRYSLDELQSSIAQAVDQREGPSRNNPGSLRATSTA